MMNHKTCTLDCCLNLHGLFGFFTVVEYNVTGKKIHLSVLASISEKNKKFGPKDLFSYPRNQMLICIHAETELIL
jgi:hypothetical protein